MKEVLSSIFFVSCLVFGGLSMITSCRKASDETPAYIRSDSSTVMSSLAMGEVTSNIYGMHMSVEGQDRGTWQFPFYMPVLAEGEKSVIFRPVVKENNISTAFVEYPLYKLKEVSLNLVRGQELDTNVKVEYSDDVTTLINETMEIKTNFSSSERAALSRLGLYSMSIKADANTIDTSATAYYYRPISMSQTKRVYWEFDYYMPEGVLAPALAYVDNNGLTQIAFGENYLNVNTGWTHVYWHLTPTVRTYAKTEYTPVFVLIPAKGKSSAQVYIDNIKILEK